MNGLRTVSLVALVAAVLVVVPDAANAAPADNNFGQHVSSCAQTMGFSATHNPGMHHGRAGWDGMPC